MAKHLTQEERDRIDCPPPTAVVIPVIDHIVVGADKAISIQEWRSGNRW